MQKTWERIMENLETAIRRAQNDFRIWTEDETHRVLTCIAAHVHGSKFDWDMGNENWGVVYGPSMGIAYVCAAIPLIIVAERFIKDIEQCVKVGDAVIFVVDDFGSPLYKVSKDILEEIFRMRLTDVVSYDALSIRDLWYATVN